MQQDEQYNKPKVSIGMEKKVQQGQPLSADITLKRFKPSEAEV